MIVSDGKLREPRWKSHLHCRILGQEKGTDSSKTESIDSQECNLYYIQIAFSMTRKCIENSPHCLSKSRLIESGLYVHTFTRAPSGSYFHQYISCDQHWDAVIDLLLTRVDTRQDQGFPPPHLTFALHLRQSQINISHCLCARRKFLLNRTLARSKIATAHTKYTPPCSSDMLHFIG